MQPAQEIADLWREMFGEPPPITADAETLSRVLVRYMTPAPPYRPQPAPKPDRAKLYDRNGQSCDCTDSFHARPLFRPFTA